MSLTFEWPEVFVLAVPALLGWWALGRDGSGRWWRLAAILLLVVAATGPELAWERGGSDVIVVFDRSSSMGAAREEQQELASLAGKARGAGDRLGVVVVGAGATVAQAPALEGVVRLLERPIADGASELAAGLEVASSLIARGRTGRVLVHSDGEITGPGLRRAAAQLAGRQIPVDVLPVARAAIADAAVIGVEVPDGLRVGESFIGAVSFVGEVPATRKWRVVSRHTTAAGALVEREVASGEVALAPGRVATVRFADRPPAAGVTRYEAWLDPEGDRVPENNRAATALRVEGGEAILVMGGDGTPGNLSAALSAAGFDVALRAEGPVSLAELLGYRALVLEQVPADKLGIESMTAVARWVEHFGGGLVMTGGRRSFGAGGYHESPIEPVLPVSMELRDEHRKITLAMAITLDRSGSMGATVPDGRTKMALANAGAVAAIQLLGPRDKVAVHAVDSAPHVVVPLSDVVDPGSIIARVNSIRSEGGGIYVYEALVAAGRELAAPGLGTRHLVMFADAADAEEPGDWKTLLAKFTAAGITVSVIGMGTETDTDAQLLKDIAAAGGGRMWFSDRAEDLPRVFAQETLLVARSAWISDPSPLRAEPLLPGVLGVAAELDGPWPVVGGYNLTYARPRSQVLAMALGDPAAPAVAVGRAGTGRAVAVPLDVDDPENPALTRWGGYGPLLAGLARWAAGAGEAAPGALTAVREGRTVTLTLELDPTRREDWPVTTPSLVLAADGEIGAVRAVAMEAVDDGVYEARITLDDTRILLPTVGLAANGQTFAVHGPALQLPYTPEAEPRWGRPPGTQVLAELARDARGTVRADLDGLYDNPASAGQLASVAPLLVILALLVLLAEVAVRRMRLGWPSQLRLPQLRKLRPARKKKSTEPDLDQIAASQQRTPAAPLGAPDRGKGVAEALREMRKRRR